MIWYIIRDTIICNVEDFAIKSSKGTTLFSEGKKDVYVKLFIFCNQH